MQVKENLEVQRRISSKINQLGRQCGKMEDKTEQKIEKINVALSELEDLLDSCDFFSAEMVNDLTKGEEIPKKKKDREAFLKERAVQRFPKIMSDIDSLDVSLQGIGVRLEEVRSKLNEDMEKLEDIESLQEEIEDKKRGLEI